ncbi:uncharacterized protein LOC117344407 [Pecten maximus]|uniref:uncharacterized protein LOC117344407 n=1 Tax=Pecten maximus TaxID=6579 RepID=UPI001458CBA6|nr:uncharacterized protein LOC117344407 [Pecten maximus]
MPNKITYFAMARKEKKEVFQISDEAVTLKPEFEPEAEIDIPAGTFNSCELLVKFVDTTEDPEDSDDPEVPTDPEGVEQERKEGEKKPEEEPVLMTSILDLSTTDGQQPNNDIEMKMPVTAKDQSEGVVVLTTSNPDPNLEEWTWDELPAEIDAAGKAVFKISHFSIYSGTSKPLFVADPEAVKNTIRKSFLKMRRVEFLVAVKTPDLDETKTDMVIICGTKRKNKAVKNRYDKSYTWFELGPEANELEFPEGQLFQIEICGNLKERADDDIMKLIFKGSKQESSRALEIVSTSPDSMELAGEVQIFRETKCLAPDRVEMVDIGCFCNKRTKETRVRSEIWETKTELLCTVPFNTTLTKREPEPQRPEYTPLSGLAGQPPPSVTWGKLKSAVHMLSGEEAKQMGYQLGLNEGLMTQVENDTMEERDLAKNVLNKWHLLLARNDMVKQLKDAMEAIGRRDIIQKIKQEQFVSK